MASSLSALGLSAGLVELAWRQDIAPFADAAAALLTVSDGNYKKIEYLDGPRLRVGFLRYEPESPEVLFQLRLFRPGLPAVTEEARYPVPV